MSVHAKKLKNYGAELSVTVYVVENPRKVSLVMMGSSKPPLIPVAVD